MSRDPTVMPESSPAPQPAAVSLGLPGSWYSPGADHGGELVLLIETTQGVTGSPDCGVVDTLHDRKAALGATLTTGAPSDNAGRAHLLLNVDQHAHDVIGELHLVRDDRPGAGALAPLVLRGRAPCGQAIGELIVAALIETPIRWSGCRAGPPPRAARSRSPAHAQPQRQRRHAPCSLVRTSTSIPGGRISTRGCSNLSIPSWKISICWTAASRQSGLLSWSRATPRRSSPGVYTL